MKKRKQKVLAMCLTLIVCITSMPFIGSAKKEVKAETFTPVTVGATDFSTEFFGAHSDSWNVEKGQSLVVTFTNYNSYTEDSENYGYYNNYCVALSTAPYGDDAYSEYIFQRSDHCGWGDLWDATTLRSWIDWTYQGAVYDEAEVQLVVSRDENNIVNVVAYAKNTVDVLNAETEETEPTELRFYNAQTFAITDEDECYAHLTVDHSYLTITDVEYYDGVVVGAPNMSSGTDYSVTPSIELNDGEMITYKLENYVGTNNWDSVRTFISNTSFGDASRSDYLLLRLDHYIESGTLMGVKEDGTADHWKTNAAMLIKSFDWNEVPSMAAYNGKDMTITIAREGNNVLWKLEIDNDGEIIYLQTKAYLPAENSPCYVWLSTCYSYFILNETTKSENTFVSCIEGDLDGDGEVSSNDKLLELEGMLEKTEFERITINKSKGEIGQIDVGTLPEGVSVKYATWFEGIVEVDENGVLTPLKGGGTTVTIVFEYEGVEKYCSVDVNVVVEATDFDIEADWSSAHKGILIDTSKPCDLATFTPEDSTVGVEFSYEIIQKWNYCYEEGVENVLEWQDGNIVAVGAGDAVVRITGVVNGTTKVYDVAFSVYTDITDIEISDMTITEGKMKCLPMKVSPLVEDIAEYFYQYSDYKSLEFESSDESVATVNQDGYVEAVAPGTATITATLVTSDGDVRTSECTVTVAAEESEEEEKTDEDSNEDKLPTEVTDKEGENCAPEEVEDDAVVDNESLVEEIIELVKEVVSETVELVSNGATTISKEVFDEVKENGKNISIGVADENNKLKYSWTFADTLLENTDIDLNINIQFDASETQKEAINEELKKVTDNEDVMYLSFDHHGELPGAATIKVYVGDKYKNGEKVYLYYFDEEVEKVLKVGNYPIEVKSGYAEYTITHCSTYFLMTENLKTIENDKNSLDDVGVSVLDRTLDGSDTTITGDVSNSVVMYGVAMVVSILSAAFILSKKKIVKD